MWEACHCDVQEGLLLIGAIICNMLLHVLCAELGSAFTADGRTAQQVGDVHLVRQVQLLRHAAAPTTDASVRPAL